MNTIRVWLSFDAWYDGREQCVQNMRKAAQILAEENLKMIPVYCNGWHAVPDYGRFSVGILQILEKRNFEPYPTYVREVAQAFEDLDVVLMHDLSNEPLNNFMDEPDACQRLYRFLKRLGDTVRSVSNAPVTIGSQGYPVKLCGCQSDFEFFDPILGLSGPGRDNGSSIMLRHLLVRFVDHGFVFCVLYDAGFKVVRREDPGYTAEEAICIDMGGDPGILLHVQKSFRVGITGVRKNRDKQICVHLLTRIGIHDVCRLTGPVHLQGLTRLVFQSQGSFGFVDEVGVVLVELGGLIRQLAVCAALLAVFHPQQTQRYAALLHLLVDVFVVRHLVLPPYGSGRIQPPGHLCLAQGTDLFPGDSFLLCPLNR